MANRQFGGVLPFLRRLLGPRGASDLTDGELLARFVSERDESAFETLLRRHGPMVLGVCRRLLYDPQEVEDAFQATFLVLVRRAGSLGRRDLVGNWLYGVAYRTALRARAQSARRRARQTPVDDVADADQPCPLHRQEMCSLLDQEVHRLPDKYRVPFVLCAIEGRTNEQAAVELGLPKGTVATRIARARARLRSRLVGRGVALSVVAAVLLPDALRAAVPPALSGATMAAGAATVAGQALAVATSASVASLTGGVLRELFVAKVRAAVGVVLAFGLAVGGGSVAWQAADRVPTQATHAEVVPATPRVREAETVPAAPAESRAPEKAPGTIIRRSERACLDPVIPDTYLLDMPAGDVPRLPVGDPVRVFRIRIQSEARASYADPTTRVWVALAACDGTVAPIPRAFEVRVRVLNSSGEWEYLGQP